jgi:hypothetical protein
MIFELLVSSLFVDALELMMYFIDWILDYFKCCPKLLLFHVAYFILIFLCFMVYYKLHPKQSKRFYFFQKITLSTDHIFFLILFHISFPLKFWMFNLTL